MSISTNKNPFNKLSFLLDQPNAHLEGNSFDASHLTSFLTNSKYSQPVFSHKQTPSYESKKTCFTTRKSSNPIDFPSNYSNLNPLVLPNLMDKGRVLPKASLEDFERGIRRELLLKNSFKSGVLNLDNPLNEESRVYRLENELFQKKQAYLAISKERQGKMVAKYVSTSPLIEFNNRNKDISVENNEKITPYWNRKSKPKEEFLNKWKDTHTRVFSVEPVKYDLKRARFLREKDIGNKEYTLITETTNNIEIKPRDIVKVLG